MAKRNLLIIDVQDYFETSSKVIDETIREIKLARRRKAAIFVVEYDRDYMQIGPTNQRVLDALEGYDKVIQVKKECDGGGKEILDACEKNGVERKAFRVVGVNRSYCVYSTLQQLKAWADSKFEVSKEGTWCTDPETGLRSLEALGAKII